MIPVGRDQEMRSASHSDGRGRGERRTREASHLKRRRRRRTGDRQVSLEEALDLINPIGNGRGSQQGPEDWENSERKEMDLVDVALWQLILTHESLCRPLRRL